MDENQSLRGRREFKERLNRGLVTRPVFESCEYCRKETSSEMAWRCGYCSYENRRTTIYSFLNKCQKCDRAPKSYVCPYCERTSILDGDGDRTRPACRIVARPEKKKVEAPKEDPRMQRKKNFEERKEALEQEIEITTLTTKLAQAKEPISTPKKDTVMMKIEKDLSEYFERYMGGYLTAKEFRVKIAERYKDDADLLERANEVVNGWLESRMG
ncbi:MAG: hypothetical protein WC661_08795 [Opitutaceae bacterium]|jgi:hypothetical protein